MGRAFRPTPLGPRGADALTEGALVEGLRAEVGGFRLGPVSFSVGPGDAVAVIGPSGAGKTTLLRTLAGFRPASEGRALVEGVDQLERPPELRRIAYVPQGLGLFPHRSVRENVAFAPELKGTDRTDPRPSELIERFGLSGLAHRRPASLSTGEQQRVAIARALAARPSLLLWDEPLVALDLVSRDDLIEALREVQRADRLPIVLVTHDPAIAFSLADRFLLLDGGVVRFSGSPSDLQRAPPTAFAARFSGYENVLTVASLRGDESTVAGWLRARAGPEGVAFPAVVPGLGSDAGWTGKVARVEPSPQGWRCAVESGGLTIRLALDPGQGVRAGDEVRLRIREGDLVPLGPAPGLVP